MCVCVCVARNRTRAFSGTRNFETDPCSPPHAQAKKKIVGVGGNLAHHWYSLWPAMIGTYGLIKWAEAHYAAQQFKHRD